jgi:hypothetical protein
MNTKYLSRRELAPLKVEITFKKNLLNFRRTLCALHVIHVFQILSRFRIVNYVS